VQDVILIAVIVAFFVGAALLVRVIDGMITHAGHDAGGEDEAGTEPQPGRPE
jgi:hypothetical protein